MSGAPLRNLIGQLFVPVFDLQRSAEWYGWLLGVEPDPPSHDHSICALPMRGEVGLALDANHPSFTADGPPRFLMALPGELRRPVSLARRAARVSYVSC